MNPGTLPPPVINALKAGNKIEAIRQLRLAKGLGLKQATDVIDAYERGDTVDFPTAPASARTSMGNRIPVEAMNALRNGRAIEAIRIIRASGNFGLAEAKAMIDEIQLSMPQKAGAYRAGHMGHRSPGEMPRSDGGGKWIVLALVAAVAIGAALYLR